MGLVVKLTSLALVLTAYFSKFEHEQLKNVQTRLRSCRYFLLVVHLRN